eukprot:scpid95740/ scgid19790/ E3 ubiquitin-protein ligase RNF19B; IBR domain-containing protein 3; Natural killer lytic-associated molecule; RING finger protein 19B
MSSSLELHEAHGCAMRGELYERQQCSVGSAGLAETTNSEGSGSANTRHSVLLERSASGPSSPQRNSDAEMVFPKSSEGLNAGLGTDNNEDSSTSAAALKPRGWRRIFPNRFRSGRRKPDASSSIGSASMTKAKATAASASAPASVGSSASSSSSGQQQVDGVATTSSNSSSSSKGRWSLGGTGGRRSRRWWQNAAGSMGAAVAVAPALNHVQLSTSTPQQQQQQRRRQFSTSSVDIDFNTATPCSGDDELSASERTCPVCYELLAAEEFPTMTLACAHRTCRSCIEMYFKQEIMESRTGLKCPQCENEYAAHDITRILSQSESPELVDRYLEFTLRRSLVSVPDMRWCPAPDCGYGVIASNCASCPKLTCKRPECGTEFCYHCQTEWHPHETCGDAYRRRMTENPTSMFTIDLTAADDESTGGAQAGGAGGGRGRRKAHGDKEQLVVLKPCPRCRSKIMKANDGSCNHITCSVCGCDFCWLCLREIDDLHFLSPSGCTFWGKSTWSRKRTIVTQLLAILGAPLGFAGVVIVIPPLVFIGLPAYFVDYANKQTYKSSVHKFLAVSGSLLGGVLLAPVITALSLLIFLPLTIFFAYAVIPYEMFKQIFPCYKRNLSPDRFGVDIDEVDSAV